MRTQKITVLALISGFLFLNTACQQKDTAVSTTNTTNDAVVVTSDTLNTRDAVKTLQLQSKSGSNITGTVEFAESDGSVKMTINASGFPAAGEYALHIHEFGDCSDDKAEAAGSHWNPTGHAHGQWDEGEFHMGDIGNMVADASGNATLDFKTDKWCLGCDDENKNIIGKSIIIHKDKDDFTTQPTGNAGDRIACVVIQ